MADVGRITELWRAAADALELPGDVEGTVPSQWLLDEKMRRQRAEAECGRLREQLDAVGDYIASALTSLETGPGKDAYAYALLCAARAALGVEGEQE